jgi:hypothetical protein
MEEVAKTAKKLNNISNNIYLFQTRIFAKGTSKGYFKILLHCNARMQPQCSRHAAAMQSYNVNKPAS